MSTQLERFQDVYKITIEPKGNAKRREERQFERDPMTFEKSITKWIDLNGVVAEDIVRKDLKRFLATFEKSAYKKKK